MTGPSPAYIHRHGMRRRRRRRRRRPHRIEAAITLLTSSLCHLPGACLNLLMRSSPSGSRCSMNRPQHADTRARTFGELPPAFAAAASQRRRSHLCRNLLTLLTCSAPQTFAATRGASWRRLAAAQTSPMSAHQLLSKSLPDHEECGTGMLRRSPDKARRGGAVGRPTKPQRRTVG